MLVYVTPILTLLGLSLLLADAFVKDERYRRAITVAKRIVCLMLGIGFLVMVIGFIGTFIQLNF